MNRSASGS
uniref:Uncharacterized protein n=1 Tax=Rhizophora mucronata TaxID=61149 RepID=A0A2P2K252_RHIMU